VAELRKNEAFLAKMFKDRDIDITLQESLINSHSIILPFIRSDGKPGRRVFVQRAPTPEIDEKIIEQRNSAVVGKLPDGRWANRLGGDENIKTMMWLPGDSITDSPEVLDNMLRNGSRTVIFNREEALKAMGKDLKDPIETGDISSHFTSKYNGIHFVVTDAGNGPYYSYKKDDKTETVKYHHPPKEFIPPDEEHNNLGAGDAFSSAYFKAINIGFTIQESLQLADEAAQIVMSHIRAAMPEDTDLSTSDMFRESS
jgi:hypothetical protein